MSNYIYFYLEIEPILPEEKESLLKDLEYVESVFPPRYGIQSVDYRGSCLSLEIYNTWGNCDEELIALSLQYPEAVFRLEAKGGESGDPIADFWIHYYKNGKIQFCPARLEYDPYNENRLFSPKMADMTNRLG